MSRLPRGWVALAAAVVVIYPLLYFGMYAGDAEIHLVYAESAAAGRFFEFNPGERSSGVTSVGYMMLLAAVFELVPIEYVPLAIKLLNLAGWYALVAITFAMARRWLPAPWALGAAVVVGVMPGSAHNSTIGMENGLFALSVIATLHLVVSWDWLAPEGATAVGRELALGAMLGLCVALRPEGVPLAGIALAYRAFVQRAALLEPGTLLRRFALPALPLVAIAGAAGLFHHSQTGDWLPGSGLSRIALSSANAIVLGPLWFNTRFTERLLQYAPLTLFFLVGCWTILTRRWTSGSRVEGLMLTLFWTFFVLYGTILGSEHLARYVTFLMPMMVLVAAFGARWAWSEWRVTAVLLPVLLLMLAAVFTVETHKRRQLGRGDELARVMRAPAARQAYSDELMARLGHPTERPVSVAMQEVQLRYRLDDRFVIRSLDGRVDRLMQEYIHDGNYDHIGYIKERKVRFVTELVNYNRDKSRWSLLELGKLEEGQELRRDGVVFRRLAGDVYEVREW